jgi:hypothetical protein
VLCTIWKDIVRVCIVLKTRIGQDAAGGKKCSHWGRYLAQKKHSRKITPSILTPFSELFPNLYYSQIKKLENIFIFKIAAQHHP